MKYKQYKALLFINKGFTLIELMISIVIGMLILSAVLTMFTGMLRSNNDNLKAIRLNQDLRATMSIISRNIRRSGSNRSAAANSVTTPPTNPFQLLAISSNQSGTANKCITFSYDADDGLNELYGYRFDNTNSEVESRSGGAACSAGGWDAVTDNTLVTITDLNFAETRITEGLIDIVQVTITLIGELKNDGTVSRTLTETIKVRNDEI